MISLSGLIAQNGVTAKLVPVNTDSNNVTGPRFPGGENELYGFLENNIRYPYILVKIGMEGDLDLRFTVDKEGAVRNVEITRGFDPAADEEAIRVVRAMPEWIPAKENGEPIDMERKLTISFKPDEDLIRRAKEQREKETGDNFYIGYSAIEEIDLPADSLNSSLNNIYRENADAQTDTLLNRAPRFPGGQDALDAYLKTNIRYPKRAIQMGIEGRVIYNILVSAKGEITRIALFKGIFRDCNEEAFYLVKKMPKWIPGLKDGKPAAMEVMLPIPFVLPK
jgi:TonB family protein